MAGDTSDDHYEFGILFVDGFRQQRPGSAVARLGGALYQWLYSWNSSLTSGLASPPTLHDVVLSGGDGEDDPPAHMTLSTGLHLATGYRDARWLLAESSWAGMFAAPQFLGIARWIWKVSTCLLVMQFFVPMRRHWDLAKSAARRVDRVAERVMALVYLVLMGVAATLSVLLSTLLLVMALAAYLPIPRIDQAVQWVVVHVSAMLGDTYMLAHCPVQFAAMRTRVTRNLTWLQGHCDKVAIVAHSQGAVLVHRVLKDSYRPNGLRALITLGQSIVKFDLLKRMEWERCERQAAHRSRTFVTVGMIGAGLPAFGFVTGHWWHLAMLRTITRFPLFLVLIATGFACVAAGVAQAMKTFHRNPRERLGLENAAFTWSDYYASADPVSNGPLTSPTEEEQRHDQEKALLVPGSCDEVYNSGSIVFDHNGYLRNRDEFLTRLLNDLVAAAYGQDADPAPRIADGVAEASRRRLWFIRALVIIRVLTAGVLAAAWLVIPSRMVTGTIASLMHLFSAHAHMNDGTSRLLTALLVTVAFYLTAILIWRYALDLAEGRFFDSARCPAPAGPPAVTDRPAPSSPELEPDPLRSVPGASTASGARAPVSAG